MRRPEIQPLFDAVRRRLWSRQFVAAARLALWAGAGLALVAAAAHLVLRPVSIDALLALLALPWLALLARAGWRRPPDAACALWADRHLGGASAYTTLMELDAMPQGASGAPARQRLEAWVAGRIPQSLAQMTARSETPYLSRPLVAMLVCAALAAFVLALPGPVPAPARPAATADAAAAAEHPPLLARAPAAAESLGEVARALRSAAGDDAPARVHSGRTQAAGSGRSDDGAIPAKSEPDAAPQGPRANGGPAGAIAAATSATPNANSLATGAGSGRDAGDSRDERAVMGTSRASPATLPVQRSGMDAGREPAARQADPDRAAAYADDPAGASRAAGPAGPVVAAAVPPAVTEAAPLTPTEARYVRAWMMANHGRP